MFRRILTTMTVLMVACSIALPVQAVVTSLPLLQAGDDEREDALGCYEPDFLAGTSSTEVNLKAGGNAWGCSSEWAMSVEFDLSDIPVGLAVFNATFTVRKTGYADDSIGFFPLGLFAYSATGGVVGVPRANLTLETLLDAVSPSSPNVDHSFDVTEFIRDAVDDGETRVGLLLASVYNEAGYHDFIYLGGAGHSSPPRLVVEHEGPVSTESSSWSAVKALFH